MTKAKSVKTKAQSGTKAKALPTKTKVKEAAGQKQAGHNRLRTPIVAVMGHVDHGKTTLLDTIRGTKVAAGEVGGITQNTRAHKVNVRNRLKLDHDQFVTFIDTPGHEAFAEMRSRGARVADMVILVVAADDGVQPQTKESIQFIKKAGVPVIIACNKIDAPGANINRIKQELSSNDILIEEYGGDAIFVPVSALKDEGIDSLLENILLVAEINELKDITPVQGSAEGFVLESNTSAELGPVALVILKAGSIMPGQYIVSKDQLHKIRATLDETRRKVEKTSQGDPVWVIGLNKVIPVGENLIFFSSEVEARSLLKEIEAKVGEKQEDLSSALDHTDVFAKLLAAKADRDDKETKLKVMVKADTQGTLEAITAKLGQLRFDGAKVEVFSAETGDLSEGDISMAHDVGAIILAFQVKVTDKLMYMARQQRVLVRSYQLIYEMLNEVEDVVNSMVAPEEEIEEIATAQVKAVFTLSNGKVVAGCQVVEGNVIKGYKIYVDRNGEEVGEGKIVSLKYKKEDIREAKKGSECGIIIEPSIALEEGDKIVCYKVVN